MLQATLHTPRSTFSRLVEYDEGREVLSVTYLSGDRYEYEGVGLDLWDEFYEHFRLGRSVGEFINARVKFRGRWERPYRKSWVQVM